MRDCAAFPGSWIKAIRHRRAALWLRARGAPDEHRADAQLCAATQKVSGTELIGIFSHQKNPKPKPFLIQWKFLWEAPAFSGIFYKSIWALVKTKTILSSKFFSTHSKACVCFECSSFFRGHFGGLLCAAARVCLVALCGEGHEITLSTPVFCRAASTLKTS